MTPGLLPNQGLDAGGAVRAVARNVSTRYLAIGVEAAVGILLLPFNVAHLGKAAYGIWMVAASITAYFSILDLGYGGAMVKFVAAYRARHDEQAINEILSTLIAIFSVVGIVAWGVAAVVSTQLDDWFGLSAVQAATGRAVLLIISAHVAAGFVFGVFGAVINGFQRYDLNNVVGAVSTLVTATVNLVALSLGYGLVALVAATTGVRLVTYFVYRANAYRVFPGLRLRLSLFRLSRLREVSGFSVFVLLLDWAAKVNYSVDALVVGAIVGAPAVAVWTVGQRLAEAVQRLTNQLNEVLFPTVVDSDAADRRDHLQTILVQGTRLSLATVLPASCALAMLARPLVLAWVGPGFTSAVDVTVLLALAVAVRVGTATSATVLKGAGLHRLLAVTNVLTAIGNLAMSVVLARAFGLPGVALGTLVPITLAAVFVLFPAACHRVELPIADAFTLAVWPALWPLLVMAGLLAAVHQHVAPSLPVVGLFAALSGALYLGLFLRLGLPPNERRVYLTYVSRMVGRLRRAEATS